MGSRDFGGDVSFEIVEKLGVITSYQTGWSKELNLVSWNGGTPKYDIRDWAPDHNHMSRGVTLHEKEMRMVLDLLRRRSRALRERRAETSLYEDVAGMPERDEHSDVQSCQCISDEDSDEASEQVLSA